MTIFLPHTLVQRRTVCILVYLFSLIDRDPLAKMLLNKLGVHSLISFDFFLQLNAPLIAQVTLDDGLIDQIADAARIMCRALFQCF
jgi:hypothetical protein